MSCGQDGYHLEIPHRKKYGEPAGCKKDKTFSMREWFYYQIQDRTNQEKLCTRGRCLFQQFLVDGYTMVETEWLYFHRAKRSKLRCDTYLNIRSSIAAGNTDPTVLGKPVVFSSSFTGGSRYMRQNYMDAMALCRWYGCPDLFITITCNPNWPEIARDMREHNLTSTDRPDVFSRVFKMKLYQLMKDVKNCAYLDVFKQDGDLVVSDEETKNVALFDIEELMRLRGTTLRRWPEMPYPDERYISEFDNQLIYDELDYNPTELQYETSYNTCETPFGNMTMVFGEWILKFGDGELGEANDGEVSIDVLEELLIDVVDDPVTSIIDFTYPNLLNNINNPSYFQEKAILSPINEVVDTINDHLLNKFPGEEMVYLSYDSIDKTERGSAIDEDVFSLEFISRLKFSGVLNHRLALKVGLPIMLLRNINQANSLCNGTRL
uniref:Uncharacterized protein n=1 Tax=Tanacetum cinerariifolium TaxID=118510 RepID=A0A699HEQ2_TANCI|nr:hypothetical protein [Tanacetum cinerariifolium]